MNLIDMTTTPGTFLAPGAAFVQCASAALARLAADESGQDLIEYALVAACMGLASVAGIHGIASQIANDVNYVVNGFNAAYASHH